MPSVADMVRAQMAHDEAFRTTLPDLPVEGNAEPPGFYTRPEYDSRRLDMIKGAYQSMGLLKKVGKLGVQTLSMTGEALRRGDVVFRGTIATGLGWMPRSKYPEFLSKALDGRISLSGHDFDQLMVGEGLMRDLDRVNLIPGWTKRAVAPNAFLGPRLTNQPVVSLGGALGFVTDAVVSPWALMAGLPVSFFEKSALGRLLAGPALPVAKGLRLGINPADSILTFPLRAASKAITSPWNGLGPLVMQLRDPVGALARHTQLVELMQLQGKALHDAGETIGQKLIDISKRHKALKEADLARVWDDLFFPSRKVLTPEQTALRDDLMAEVVMPLWGKLRQMGYTRLKGANGKILMKWDRPMDQKLSVFNPTIRSFRNFGISEEPTWAQQMRVYMPWRRNPPPFNPATVLDVEKNPYHAVEHWAGMAERKAILDGTEKLPRIKNRVPTGLANLYRLQSPRYETHIRKASALIQNAKTPQQLQAAKELAGLSLGEFKYLTGKVRDFTGHRAGKFELFVNDVMASTISTIEKAFGPARASRVRSYFTKMGGGLQLGDPFMTSTGMITGLMTRNMIIATLGGNLSSALKNSSQAINQMTKSGVPATIRGLYRMADHFSPEGKMLDSLRKDARMANEFRRVMYDDMWLNAGFTHMMNAVMTPFNFMENIMRGTSFNVKVGQSLEARGVRSLSDLNTLAARTPGLMKRLLAEGVQEAHDVNFVYGIAGRSHLLSSPVARVGLALQSYSWKQSEFMARSVTRDGSAFYRMLGLNGWVIDMANRHAGINAENWLGWGFLPPNNFMTGGVPVGPFADAIMGGLRALHAAGDDDENAYRREISSLRSSIREIPRLFGHPDAGPEWQAILGGMGKAGLLPLPIVAIAKTARLGNELLYGKHLSQSARTWTPITPADAVRSYFFQTHVQAEDARMRQLDASARKQLDRELDRRVDSMISALGYRGDKQHPPDGQKVLDAARLLVSPVGLNLRLSQGPFSFMGDERSIWPHMDMIERRLQERLLRKTLPEGVVDMIHSGWVGEVLWGEYLNRALRELEAAR